MAETRDIHEQNRMIIDEVRSNGGESQHGDIVLITHVGRKSGKSYTNPLAAAADGADVIIAGTKGGVPEHPQWYLNLVDTPQITVEWRGETYPAVAQTITEPVERQRLVDLLTPALPGLPRYEQRTEGKRQIPIIRLVRS